MIAYHGTNQIFEEFSMTPSVRSTHGASAASGIFMTTLPQVAEQYAAMAQSKLYPGNHDEHIRKVADLVKRSQMAERRRDFELAEKLMDEAERIEAAGRDETVGARVLEIDVSASNPMIVPAAGRMDLYDMRDLLEEAFEGGHDAVILKDVWDPAKIEDVGEPYDHVIVRDPALLRILSVREVTPQIEEDSPSP